MGDQDECYIGGKRKMVIKMHKGMRKMKGSGFIAGTIAALLILGMVSMVPSVNAVPPIPQLYQGYVKLNGEPVVDGTNVSIWDESGNLIKTTWTYFYEGQGFYTISAPGNDTSTPEDEGFEDGEKITFKIDDLTADQYSYWHEGGGFPIWLNLTASGTSSTGDLHNPDIKAVSGATWNPCENKWEAPEGAIVTMKANVTIDLPSVTGPCTYRNVTIKVVYNKSWWSAPTGIIVDGGSPPTNWDIATSYTSGTTNNDGWYVEAKISYHSTGPTVEGSANASVTFNTTAPLDASDDGNGITFAVSCSSGYSGSITYTGAACDSTIGDAIPEFSTLLIPVIGTIFLFFLMRKKYKK